jgi:alpha-L-fucosidase
MNTARAEKLLPLLKLQPRIITNNRLDKNKSTGDFETPEQKIPATGIAGTDWETCMTMNRTWGFRASDENWKSTETLVRNLVDIASKGGNYLLNIGPDRWGNFPAPSVERLKEVGAWMKVNGAAIYGTTASPFENLAWGRCTKKVGAAGATLYLHVFAWPTNGKLFVPGLKSKVASATLLATQQALPAQATEDGWEISVPTAAPDKISTTIVLRLNGAIQIAAAR